MVDENNCVGGADAAHDRRPRAIAINQPPLLRQQRFVGVRKIRFGSENPLRLPLDFVDRVVGQRVHGAKRATHRGFSAPGVPYDHHSLHVQFIPHGFVDRKSNPPPPMQPLKTPHF
jgi:hypothetical protein